MNTFSIRPYLPTDFERIDEIRTAAFAPVFQSFRSLVGERIAAIALTTAEDEQAAHLRDLCKPDAANDLFVIEENAEIVGFCAVLYDQDNAVGEIGLNAVDPGHQGAGAGKAMYDHALAMMREKGMRAATVGTGGDDAHAPARRAYEKAGFSAAIPNVYFYRLL